VGWVDRFGLANLWDADVAGMVEDAEGIEQPHDDANDHDNVQDFFDFPVHRDIGVDQPEQHTHDDQGDDKIDQWHILSPEFTSGFLFTKRTYAVAEMEAMG